MQLRVWLSCLCTVVASHATSCPNHSAHFYSLQLPTHGKTAVAEANQACATGSSTCSDCCLAALTHCGETHVNQIIPGRSPPRRPETRSVHDFLELPRCNPPAHCAERLANATSTPILSLFVAAAVSRLADVAADPVATLIPSASAYKPQAGQRLLPLLESGESVLAATEDWEVKAVFSWR
eukprot:Protomagalhaensia_wolfi_Nauph_80__1384@NODE_182_length_3270_cov_138_750232_g137_i0_p3_GENE_NODE_182_length_3270_cov_138_750232_g137_i0NODE_182_length_3270_cov_138_750232_g137_i0_p3_ORF_typecomplete_len181_score10_64_NODE_182_length_3270_cov_138_750232_g137_i016942236